MNPEGRRRVALCSVCGYAEHRFLCDYRLDSHGFKTCDKKMCAVCVTRMGSRDYCPKHAEEVRKQR